MSLIFTFLCLSPAYQPLLCGLVGRDVRVPHFVSLTGVPAFIVRSCRERRVCFFLYFCVSHQCTSPLCSLVWACTFSVFLCSIISSTHYNMSNFMQEWSLYITTLKMNGSELLFVYNNVEMVATFVVYLFT